MKDEQQKINIPEDFLGAEDGTKTEAEPEVRPEVKADPEVIAEEKKLRLSQLKWKRYIVGFKGVAVALQTFKSEAVSLVSGLGTLVLGWFQLHKWVLTGRKEVKVLKHKDGQVPKPVPRASRREAREEVGHGTGSGYGSSAGGLGGDRPLATARKTKTMEPVPPPSGERIPPLGSREPIAMVPNPIEVPTMFTDPQAYVWFGLIGTFLWSTVFAWFKKRRKQNENGGK